MTAATGSRDASGRRKRLSAVSTGKRITLQERDWLWLQMLHEHGPLASSFLLAFAKDLGVSEKRAKERLTDLFNEDSTAHKGSYLTRPPQQFHTLDSRYNQIVYDIAPAGVRALKERGTWRSSGSPSGGPWLHTFMASSITASIRLAAKERADLAYITQAEILERAGSGLSCPVEIVEPTTKQRRKKALKPDALFGVAYETDTGRRYRFFVVEADRSTEPLSSRNFNRKSVLRNYLQYREYVGRGRYKEHLKLTAPLLVLNVCSDQARVERIQKLITDQGKGGNSYLLFQSWEEFAPPFRPPRPNSNLLVGLWHRPSKDPIIIADA